MFPSSGYGYVGKLLELLEGCQGAFRYSRSNVGFLLSGRIGKEPHLAWRGESPGLSPVVVANVGFLSSDGRDLRGPLVCPQESPVSMRVAGGLSGFLCSRCRVEVLIWNLEWRSDPQVSSPVPTWISAFLWSFHREARPHLVWKHGSPLFSPAGKTVVRIPVVMT